MPKLNKQKAVTNRQSRLTSLEKQLFEAAKKEDVDKFVEITKKGVDPFTKDKSGLYAVHYFILGNLCEDDKKKIKSILDKHISELRLLRRSLKE